ncbi:hypothetical protein HDV00_004438 [Rhizophlyctis rosea]|nr:hypothetical protein HDV00_004438 [Rhizophlyctis rosea]
MTIFKIGVLLAVKYRYPDLRDFALPHIPFATPAEASRKGSLSLLKWWGEWKTKGKLPRHIKGLERGVEHASRSGRVDILNWWKELDDHGRPLFSDLSATTVASAVVVASADGNVTILEWWKATGRMDGKRFDGALTKAIENGHASVLEWWATSGLPWIYSGDTLNSLIDSLSIASANGHVAILQYWWKALKPNAPWPDNLLNRAIENGRINVLEWWRQSQVPLKTEDWMPLDLASKLGKVFVLDWWKHSGLDVRESYSQDAMDLASKNGHVAVLQWWKDSGLQLKWSPQWVMNWAIEAEDLSVLEWWRKSGLELQWSTHAIQVAQKRERTRFIKWWEQSGLEKEGVPVGESNWLRASVVSIKLSPGQKNGKPFVFGQAEEAPSVDELTFSFGNRFAFDTIPFSEARSAERGMVGEAFRFGVGGDTGEKEKQTAGPQISKYRRKAPKRPAF